MSFLYIDLKFAIRELWTSIIEDIVTRQNSGQKPGRDSEALQYDCTQGHCLGLVQLTVAGNIREFKNDVGDGNVS